MCVLMDLSETTNSSCLRGGNQKEVLRVTYILAFSHQHIWFKFLLDDILLTEQIN